MQSNLNIFQFTNFIEQKVKLLSFFSALSHTSSGASVDSLRTPLKVLEKDTCTGEYIVHMSPQDFDRIANQNRVMPMDTR